MVPNRLAFVREFERELRSPSLYQWFEALPRYDSGLEEFTDPTALREFLHGDGVDARKPEVWRALVKGVQLRRSPHATLYILGLLEPALGNLVDEFASGSLDREDLWQEAVRGALRALRNPRLPERNEVLAGLARDTRKYLCAWLRIEISKAEGEAPLLEMTYETNFDEVLDGIQGEALLTDWCRHASISSDDAAVIFATRVVGLRLSQLAPIDSRLYQRLKKRRSRAEARLKSWLTRRPKT